MRNIPDDFTTEAAIPTKRMKDENTKDKKKVRAQGR
jgi:hypothetical protein